MRTDFERWFITGFIAGLIATNPSLLMYDFSFFFCYFFFFPFTNALRSPQSLMVLRRMSAKKEDLSEAPMIIYAALLCSRTKEVYDNSLKIVLELLTH